VDRVPRQWGFIFWWTITPLTIGLLLAVAFHFDDTARAWISAHQNHALHVFMRNVSRFGDWFEHFVLGMLLLTVAWWRGSKNWTRIFLSMLIALALAGAVGRVIKISTGRARPSVKTEQAWNGPRLSSKFHAFPSGHVAASTAFFAVLFFVNWRLGLACLPIPLLIGFSRMYVAAHYLSDVVCAVVLGILCALLVTRLLLDPIANRKTCPERTKEESNKSQIEN
jgi:membrane-associated phospholipid phosphatase